MTNLNKILKKLKARLLLLSLFLTTLNCYSQLTADKASSVRNEKITYFQIDFSVPLKTNPYLDDDDVYSDDESEYWFAPDGIAVRAGFGIHFRKWIALGLHSGIDWKASEKLVVAPVFANVKLSPRLTKDDEMRLYLSFGLGKSFALGRGNLNGKFTSGRFGIEALDEDTSSVSFYLDISHYDFPFRNYNNGTGSFSLGIAVSF